MRIDDFELPRYMRMTKQEEKEFETFGNHLFRKFGLGLIWFIDIPRRIIRRFRK